MPYKPRVPCQHPGCPELVEPGKRYCEKHKAMHPEAVRSARKAGYSKQWEKASKRYLQSHPLCARCMAKDPPVYRKAEVTDHIIPHRGDPKLFWNESNWQPLCKRCHDIKTLTEDINPEYRY